MTDETATDTEFDKLRDDVYAEIGLATGWDDSDDEMVDTKRRITDAVMRYLGRDLLAAEARVRAVEAECDRLARNRGGWDPDIAALFRGVLASVAGEH